MELTFYNANIISSSYMENKKKTGPENSVNVICIFILLKCTKKKRKMKKQKWKNYNEVGAGNQSENFERLSNENGLSRTR